MNGSLTRNPMSVSLASLFATALGLLPDAAHAASMSRNPNRSASSRNMSGLIEFIGESKAVTFPVDREKLRFLIVGPDHLDDLPGPRLGVADDGVGPHVAESKVGDIFPMPIRDREASVGEAGNEASGHREVVCRLEWPGEPSGAEDPEHLTAPP